MSAHSACADTRYLMLIYSKFACSSFWMLSQYYLNYPKPPKAVLIPQCCTCSIDGHAMIWRSSPLYSSWSKPCSLWNTCWMLFCRKKKSILLQSAGGKLNHISIWPLSPYYPVSMSTTEFCRSLIQPHLAPWWIVHRKQKYFSIRVQITLTIFWAKRHNLHATFNQNSHHKKQISDTELSSESLQNSSLSFLLSCLISATE